MTKESEEDHKVVHVGGGEYRGPERHGDEQLVHGEQSMPDPAIGGAQAFLTVMTGRPRRAFT